MRSALLLPREMLDAQVLSTSNSGSHVCAVALEATKNVLSDDRFGSRTAISNRL